MGISFVFSAQLENIEHLCAKTTKFLNSNNITAESFDILLVLRELVNNAVIHGCKQHIDQCVYVQLTLDRHNVLHLEVEDQGNGFDWHSRLQDSVVDSRACSGRGIGIVQCYADSCTFNASGNRVRIQKKISLGTSSSDRPCGHK